MGGGWPLAGQHHGRRPAREQRHHAVVQRAG
jgi:hypothetical protein